MGYIYKHTNKINGKSYIGKTVQEPKTRWRNGKGYKSCVVFNNAIKLYGWDSFEHEILEIIDDEKLIQREEFYIKHFNTLAPNGYNLIEVDKGLNKYPEEIRNKISKARIAYYQSLDNPIIAYNRNHHIYNSDGSVHKKCLKCELIQDLSEFGVYKTTWDGLNRHCRNCHNNSFLDYKKQFYKKKNENELAQSYVDRREAISVGLKLKAKLDPSYGKNISKRNSKPIIRTLIDGTIKIYKNTYDLKADGLDPGSVRKSINNQSLYKDSYFKDGIKIDDKIINPNYMIFDEEMHDPVKSAIWMSINNENKTKIYARKCTIKELTHKEQNIFCQTNHLQGGCVARIKLGLFYENELVAVMTFGTPRYNKEYQWELLRFCSKLNTQVIGGASKLFQFFKNNYSPKNIISYANCRFSKGKLYETLGFTYKYTTQPNYFYCKEGKIYNRTTYQKHKLHYKLTNFDPNLSEKQNMFNNGFNIKKDRGNLVYELIF